MRRQSVTSAALALVLLALVATAAMAQEEEGGAEEPAVVVDDGGAAVPVPPPEAEAEELPWTSRFLPPALALLTVLTIGGFALYYIFGVRRRYQVVGE